MNIENKSYLWDELLAYENDTEMTDTERSALHAWVLEGNSVHDNGSMAYTESGIPCDFLDVYRYEEIIRENLEKLEPREKKNYLARISGEATIDNLQQDLNELYNEAEIYKSILQKHGLLEEAEQELKNSKERLSKQILLFNEWFAIHPEDENVL